ncbi:MAG: hypothetical protein K6G28_06590 [Acholeplasmatales bacterium]|nr:hypothetical protein [Acholeplasmatales bacterium]
MKTGPTFELDYSKIISKLGEYKGKKITVIEHKTRNKNIERRGTLALLTEKLFTFSVPLGRTHTVDYSYTFGELEMGKVEVVELNNITVEE